MSIQKVTSSRKNALFSDFTTLYDFADPNHLLPTGKSSGKSKYVVPKIQPVRPSSVYAAAVTQLSLRVTKASILEEEAAAAAKWP